MLKPEEYIIRGRHGYGTVLEMAEDVCRKYAGKTAMRLKANGTYQKYTYGDLWTSIIKISAALHKHGLAPGDRAAVYGENRPEWAMAYLGISKAGGIVVPIDVLLGACELEYVLNHSAAKIIFVSKKYLDNVLEIADRQRSLKR